MSSRNWRGVPPMADRRAIDPIAADLLFQSDQDYFAAAAEEVSFPGGRLLRMPGLEQVPAGCIAVPDADLASPDAFLAEAAGYASEAGASLLRFYTAGANAVRDAALVGAGLHRSVEQGFVVSTQDLLAGFRLVGTPGASVRPVREDGDWKRKERLSAALEQLPDGKQANAAAWTMLERRKCEAGYMDAFLIELEGECCGAFGLASSRRLLRLKNLVVHPAYRRRGVGRAAVSYAAMHAREAGFDWLGVYALEASNGGALYAKSGLAVVTEQIEWTRPLCLADNGLRPTLRQTA